MKKFFAACVLTVLTMMAAFSAAAADYSLEISYAFSDNFGEAEIAPFALEPFSDWTPNMRLPRRRLTEDEIDAWIAHYCYLGGVTDSEREILRLTNIHRAAVGAPPLTLDYGLSRAARFKSQEMVDLQYHSHDSPVYGDFLNIPNLFVNWHRNMPFLGENIAHTTNWPINQLTPEIFVNAWFNSAGHRRNMLNPNFTTMGAGVFMESPFGSPWRINSAATQLFGRGVVQSPPCLCGDVIIPTTWENLQGAIVNSPVNATQTTFIYIPEGVTITGPTTHSAPLNVVGGRNITLIGGGTIDRGLSEGVDHWTAREPIFFVGESSATPVAPTRSVLTLDGPTITGGDTVARGAVYVRWSGTFILNSGEISGNRGNQAVSLDLGSPVNRGHLEVVPRFYMNGGAIRNNGGRGVRLNRGFFTMSSGEISGNNATVNGAGVAVVNAVFEMLGGEITGNTTTQRGGGVHLNDEASTNPENPFHGGSFYIRGGSITGNTATVDGGGLFTGDSDDVNINVHEGDDGVIENNHPNNIAPAVRPTITSRDSLPTDLTHITIFRVTASGYPRPTFSLEDAPPGVSIDPVTGVITIGTPPGGIGQMSGGVAPGPHTFYVIATNPAGESRQAFTLTIDPPTPNLPVIFNSPTDKTADENEIAVFTAIVLDLYPVPELQWQVSENDGVDWSDIPGETADTFTVTALRNLDGNMYRITAENSMGVVYSNPATLTVMYGGVLPPPCPDCGEDPCVCGFGPVPPTGVANIAGLMSAMFALFAGSAVLWVYAIRRRRICL